MTKTQLKKIINIIRADANLRNYYVDQEGEACVIGGLALAMGFPRHSLARYQTTPITKHPRLVKKLKQAYGLTAEDLNDLQYINDEEFHTEDRRRRLINYLKTQYADL